MLIRLRCLARRTGMLRRTGIGGLISPGQIALQVGAARKRLHLESLRQIQAAACRLCCAIKVADFYLNPL